MPEETEEPVVEEEPIEEAPVEESEVTEDDDQKLTHWSIEDGMWKYENGVWTYVYSDGSLIKDTRVEINGSMFEFDKDGKMLTGWQKTETTTTDADGNEVTNTTWHYYDPATGAGHTGWLLIGGTWYYLGYDGDMYDNTDSSSYIDGVRYRFHASGAMVTGWYADQSERTDSEGNKVTETTWYYYDASGAPHSGWLLENGKWYYTDPDGSMAQDTFTSIGGTNYAFDKSGAMVVGWYSKERENYYGEKEVTWYYCDASGAAHDGWLLENNTWYYLNNGHMVSDGVREINGTDYLFNKSGAMTSGWYAHMSKEYDKTDETTGKPIYKDVATWYYADANGVAQKGWILDGGKWYFLDRDTHDMYQSRDNTYARSWNIDGKEYRFDKSGAMITGWYLNTYTYTTPEWDDEKQEYVDVEKTRSDWYYHDTSGAAHKGWLLYNGTWYYTDPDGQMYCKDKDNEYDDGQRRIDRVLYQFDENGAMLTGGSTGWRAQEWIDEDDDNTKKITWFYHETSGAIRTGWLQYNNNWYYLDKYDGQMYVDEMCGIDGRIYLFDKNGIMKTGWYEDTDEGFEGSKYYFDNSGAMVKGWQEIGGKKYYFATEDGTMYSEGTHTIGGKDYTFDKDGVCTGEVKDDSATE